MSIGRVRSPRTLTAFDSPTSKQRPGRAPEPWLSVDDGGGLAQAPWRALCPRRVLELRDPSLPALRHLPSGTSVALVSDGPLSRLRLRRRARQAGIRIDRELIVVPSTAAPLVVLDDTEEAVRHFWSSVAAVPPGFTWASGPASAVLMLGRLLPWRLTGACVPGRVLVGIRR
jgi:hypothetical protein